MALGTTSIETAVVKQTLLADAGGPFMPPVNSARVQIFTQTEMITEGETAQFAIVRDGVTTIPCSVNWRSENPPGGQPGFVTVQNVTANFLEGQTVVDVILPTANSTGVQGSRIAKVILSEPLGASISPSQGEASVTIVDTLTSSLSVSVNPTSLVEGNVGTNTLVRFSIARTGDLSQSCSVIWSRGGTIADTDLVSVPVPGTLNFGANVALQLVDFTIKGDVEVEAAEMLSLTIASPVNCTIAVGGNTAQVTVTNDDTAGTAPTVSLVPQVSGLTPVGSTLLCSQGTWLGTPPIGYLYQWRRGAVNINGATASSYISQTADIGQVVSCSVQASNGFGTASSNSANGITVTALPTAPAIVDPPAVSGPTVVNSTLTSTQGSWTGATPITYSYQWYRDTTAVGTPNSTTYLTVAADVGRTIYCRVTASNSVGTAFSNSNGVVVTSAPTLPALVTAPAISGSTTVNNTLTTTNGSWTGATPITYSYQWLRGGTVNVGTNSPNYLTVNTDVDDGISCRVTALNSVGTASAVSNSLTIVSKPINVTPPLVTGLSGVGNLLTTGNGTWDGIPTSYLYQWVRDTTDISGATSKTYTTVYEPGNVDIDASVWCRVTARNALGNTIAVSNTVVVTSKPIAKTPPIVTGSTVVGDLLTTDDGTWYGIPTSFSYEWLRDNVVISGQNAKTYRTTTSDLNNNVFSRVTATNALGTDSFTSNFMLITTTPVTPGLPAPLRLIEVNSKSELQGVLILTTGNFASGVLVKRPDGSTWSDRAGPLRPGDHVVLKPATDYGGTTYTIPLAIAGTSLNPIIVRATAFNDRVQCNSDWVLNGPYTGIAYLDIHNLNKQCVYIGNREQRVFRCWFKTIVRDGIIKFSSGGDAAHRQTRDSRISYNTFEDFTGAAISQNFERPDSPDHRGRFIDHNHFKNHNVAAVNESVILILTNSFIDVALTEEYNWFDNVLNDPGNINNQNEMVTVKTRGVTFRGNTVTNSGSCFLCLRETNNCIVDANWFDNGAHVQIFGDNHRITNNRIVSGSYECWSGDAYMCTQNPPTLCNPGGDCSNFGKDGQATLVVKPNGKCGTAHCAARDTYLENNMGTIEIGTNTSSTSYYTADALRTTLVRNQFQPDLVSGRYNTVNESGRGNHTIVAKKLLATQVGHLATVAT